MEERVLPVQQEPLDLQVQPVQPALLGLQEVLEPQEQQVRQEIAEQQGRPVPRVLPEVLEPQEPLEIREL